MADYIVNVGVKDNASQSLNEIKQGFNDVGQATSELDKVKQRFDKITSSSAPAKKQLRDLQQILASLNLKGLTNTDVFTEVAMKAGELKDAMADAQQAVAAYSNDVFNLKAAAESFEAITAAGSMATSAMALFGSENKDLQKVLVKVQAAQGMVNAATALSNVLNKDSALMLKLKQIRLAANTAAQTKDTIATTANTVATGANTVATVANTVAQKAWNVAKAIGKAMFGDFTGLVLLGIGAVAAYTLATDSATDSEEQHNKTLTDAQKLAKQKAEDERAMAQATASAASQQLGAYFKLQQKWNECNGDIAKQKKFMSDYKDEIHNTGFAVNDLKSAEDFFVNNTDAVIQAIMQRARAQAAYEVMVDKLKKSLEKLEEKSVRSGNYYTNANQDNITDDERNYLKGKGANKGYFKTRSNVDSFGINHGDFETNTLTDKGLEEINKRREQQARERQKTWQASVKKEMDENTKFYAEIVTDANGKLAEIQKKYGLQSYTPPKKTGGGNGNKKTETPAAKGSIADMEKDISDLENSLKKGLVPAESIGKTIDTIRQLKEKVEKEKIRLGLTTAPEAGTVAALQKELNELTSKLQNELITGQDLENAKKKVAQLQADINKKKMELGLEPVIEEGSIADLQQQISKIDDKLKNTKLDLAARIELQGKKQELQNQLDKLSNLHDLTIKAQVEPTVIKRGSIDDKRASYSNAISNANRIQDDLDAGIINTKQAKAQIAEINQELSKLGLKPIKIDIQTDWDKFLDGANAAFDAVGAIDGVVNSMSNLSSAIEDGADAWTIFTAAISVVESVIGAINTVMEVCNLLTNLGTASKLGNTAASEAASIAATEEAAVEGATIAPKTAETVANKALEASLLDLAAAQIFAAHAAIPFAGPGIAAGLIAGMMAAMAAQHAASLGLQALAGGGIINGSSRMGDHLLARVNAGEMVLNGKQQKNLFNAIDNGTLGGGSNVLVGGEIRIKGSDLYVALKNFNKQQGMIGRNIGIR